MPDDRFDIPRELRESGASARDEDVGEKVGIKFFAERAETLERVLRMQFEDGELPEKDEKELRSPRRQVRDLQSAMRRWAYLKHVHHRWLEGLDPADAAEEADEDQLRAMVELLRTEPIQVELTTGRTVDLTDRSYAALREIGRHATRISELERDMNRIADLVDRIRERLADEEREGESDDRLYRRLQWLLDFRQVRIDEREEHRRAIVAHLTTEDGSPADSREEAPEWADEIGPLDEIALITGIRRAMVKRVSRLGERPEHPREGSADHLEDWGLPAWLVPFRDFDDRTPVDAADPLDVRIGKAIALRRADSPLVFESDRKNGGPGGGPRAPS